MLEQTSEYICICVCLSMCVSRNKIVCNL